MPTILDKIVSLQSYYQRNSIPFFNFELLLSSALFLFMNNDVVLTLIKMKYGYPRNTQWQAQDEVNSWICGFVATNFVRNLEEIPKKPYDFFISWCFKRIRKGEGPYQMHLYEGNASLHTLVLIITKCCILAMFLFYFTLIIYFFLLRVYHATVRNWSESVPENQQKMISLKISRHKCSFIE